MSPVRFNSVECLIAYFQMNGSFVGPRTGPDKRTQDQKEIYNLRQYLSTLAHHGLLHFPLTVEKGEKPDFALSDGSAVTWGLEITEATTKDWQRELTTSEGKSPTVTPLGRDGWAGNSAERETCAAILRAMRRKARKVRQGHYRPVSRYDVLIYVNVRAFFYSAQETIALLLPRIARWQSQWAGLGRVEIITSLHLFSDVLNGPIRLSLFDFEAVNHSNYAGAK